MSEPPTLLIPEIDEDRTLVETRNANLDCSLAELSGERGSSWPVADRNARASRCASSVGRKLRLRRCAEGIVVFGLVAGLTFVGYQQWRIAESIRKSISGFGNTESPPPNHDAIPKQERFPRQIESASDPDSTSQETLEARRDRLESVGAALIRANDFEAALNHYRALAQALPGEAVFRDLVLVLQSKLRCERSLSLTNVGCP